MTKAGQFLPSESWFWNRRRSAPRSSPTRLGQTPSMDSLGRVPFSSLILGLNGPSVPRVSLSFPRQEGSYRPDAHKPVREQP